MNLIRNMCLEIGDYTFKITLASHWGQRVKVLDEPYGTCRYIVIKLGFGVLCVLWLDWLVPHQHVATIKIYHIHSVCLCVLSRCLSCWLIKDPEINLRVKTFQDHKSKVNVAYFVLTSSFEVKSVEPWCDRLRFFHFEIRVRHLLQLSRETSMLRGIISIITFYMCYACGWYTDKHVISIFYKYQEYI